MTMLLRGGLLSALLTAFAFLASVDNGFVALDDYAYIVNNPHIETLDWGTILWAITSFHEGNWHPLTMLSLAVDRAVWGLNPLGFHLTNIIVHSATVFVSCYLFADIIRVATSTTDNSCRLESDNQRVFAAVAGALFFGIHPLRVESVVWASERKDVLCVFFMVCAVRLYLRYATERGEQEPLPFYRFKSYWGAFALAALALMSKPAAVSLPFILLIIDWFPLGRFSTVEERAGSVREKIPFLLLSGAGVALTLAAQQVAMRNAPDIDFLSRLLVGCKALLFYPVKTAWPSNLAAFYRHPGNVAHSNLPEYLLYAAIVAFICLGLYLEGRRRKMLPALGLYYGVTILPMIGVIQVGGQWVADRYSYLPALGFSLAWGWGVVWIAGRLRRHGRRLAVWFCTALAICQLGIYSVLTVRQIRVWKDTETLATRIIDLMPHRSGAAYYARALYRYEQGRNEQALDDVVEATKIALRQEIKGSYPDLGMLQSRVLHKLGRYDEALAMADWAVTASPVPLAIDFLLFRQELIEKAASAGKRSLHLPADR